MTVLRGLYIIYNTYTYIKYYIYIYIYIYIKFIIFIYIIWKIYSKIQFRKIYKNVVNAISYKVLIKSTLMQIWKSTNVFAFMWK